MASFTLIHASLTCLGDIREKIMLFSNKNNPNLWGRQWALKCVWHLIFSCFFCHRIILFFLFGDTGHLSKNSVYF